MKKYYITSPLYYVNAKPHIGHAYTTILCDAFARFERFLHGKDSVFFLTGTDEHGEKIAKAAREEGKEVKAFVDEIVPHFKALWKDLGISYDYFIRTTDPDHEEIVQKILVDLVAKGDIYKGEYKGWYCTPCESFWTSMQLKESKCPDCHRDVTEIREENYFFKLSKYQKWLTEYIRSHPDFVIPQTKENEILSFLGNPLEDLCITRPRERLSWGIPFPNDERYVVYVWFDALINYISAPHFLLDPERFRTIWPADIHMIGKDILRQHAVYWPIMLRALGVEMPRHVVAHGWWTIEGTKVSKSRGNVVDPQMLVQLYGQDTLRYYLLKEVTVGQDGAYSEELLIQRFNVDLANNLGNLVHRTFAMLEKYFGGVVPEAPSGGDASTRTKTLELLSRIQKAMEEELNPQAALVAIWQVIDHLNKFIEDSKPWVLAKSAAEKGKLADFLYTVLEALRIVALVVSPFLPATSEKILALLKWTAEPCAKDAEKWGLLKAGSHLKGGAPLFPRVE